MFCGVLQVLYSADVVEVLCSLNAAMSLHFVLHRRKKVFASNFGVPPRC